MHFFLGALRANAHAIRTKISNWTVSLIGLKKFEPQLLFPQHTMQILTDTRWHEVCNVGQMARLCLPRQLVMVDVAVCFIDTVESNAMKLPGAET